MFTLDTTSSLYTIIIKNTIHWNVLTVILTSYFEIYKKFSLAFLLQLLAIVKDICDCFIFHYYCLSELLQQPVIVYLILYYVTDNQESKFGTSTDNFSHFPKLRKLIDSFLNNCFI